MTLENLFENCELPVELTYKNIPVEINKQEDYWAVSINDKDKDQHYTIHDSLEIALETIWLSCTLKTLVKSPEDRIKKLEQEVAELKKEKEEDNG